ncbi:hypothetical protein [Pseudoalteromonas luteoviolacea]|uniref:Uncharacterized protein n=1 Tax=Pseudoalteromonas luteoviolacea S4054 TaxID=1129367 RepID=A0A0F6AFK1_9GAMM|nr:hypothetical protein [Pseudoalteromonas luteoviolacea]AOT09297.1 hypothetical protein S4054249_16220 [Pseudoalteromonas luteoviolacea]AOT14209.1 hypothetical protein S40542_16190 [Pseudoalteromonas luteoviolacea]AOT19125.1 hypothetical protein S4054_16195 [Pseudoalteromonas luteoviolacea]KKE84985.1 hypothetical protein N479_06020 [Pseudoalteromonas luteoviolacea S4054]KZN70103.1 hypothetical protein N481_01130 [Pseudoalteromonas luteoviolacea S4047-1]
MTQVHDNKSNEQAVAELILAIRSKDLSKILSAYQQQNDVGRAAQLKFCFETGESQTASYADYQNIAAQCIAAHGLPPGIIAGLNNSDRVSFFMPALQASDAFSQTNHQGNTFLHALFANTEQSPPPFNFIRSLLLFERNESLAKALRVRNQHGLTPLECYFVYNLNNMDLPEHELTALFALIEAEQADNISPTSSNLSRVKDAMKNRKINLEPKNQILLIVASYYQIDINALCQVH